ncbi:hypothetical protein FF38_04106 [Lucilia cuprina]|uniref:Uncharacterized protein n=1 Tax=Lucilia cuprina TaxID=7375 RepID=A0A0L0BRU9_LUCCU|nr:hypothetical protein CVS40_7399 [Lucilia cuprina]KNC22751.1 hypothetical protein FF38_04106 [Lucilia cuprina]
MKIYIFFLITATILICSKTIQAGSSFIIGDQNSYDDSEIIDNLNRNSIYRDKEQVVVRELHDHKLYKNLEKDTTRVIVKDANGNVQESTKVYIAKRRD